LRNWRQQKSRKIPGNNFPVRERPFGSGSAVYPVSLFISGNIRILRLRGISLKEELPSGSFNRIKKGS
jgi:hypothetical protein